MRARILTQRAAEPSPDLAAVGAVALLVYFVMVGDPAWRDTHPAGLVLHGLLAAGLVLLYVLRAPDRGDHFDQRMVLALLLFAVAGVFSMFPRQSFDSALVAIVYASGLFLAREILSRPVARRVFVVGLTALSAVVTIIVAAQWLPLYLRWWALTDWTVVPPLSMNLPSSPWGHRHDLALLLAMLYPVWWIGRITPVRAVAAFLTGSLVLLLIVIGGSRMVWLGVAIATAAVVAPMIAHRLGWSRARLTVFAAVLLLSLLAIGVTGVAGPLLERLLGGASLAERTAMWGPLMEAWGARPLVGHGPGSFPWILQQTDYFNTFSFAPRHPDSAVIQLLAECGILGAAAALILVVTVAPRLFRGQSKAATWAVIAFGVAALAGNPTDFEFMVAMAVGWLAFAVPRIPGASTNGQRTYRGPVRAISLAVVGIIGLAFGATVAANVAYSSARAAVAAGRLGEVAEPLRIAATLDPGLAIYPRQLGTLHLLSGEALLAQRELERAVSLSPSDDLAWRILALAYAQSSDAASSWSAIGHAVTLQRSDPTNLLLAARALIDAGDEAASSDLLAEITQAWPETVATPEWDDLIDEASATMEILHAANDRWARGDSSPEPLTAQPLLLQAMIGESSMATRPWSSRLTPELTTAYAAVMSCHPTAATSLAGVDDSGRRHATYWALAVRQAALEGGDTDRTASIHAIMTGDPLLADPDVSALNPLHENGVRGSSADRWGYRRAPIRWPATPWDLPSPRSGVTLLYLQPLDALRAVGLGAVLAQCG